MTTDPSPRPFRRLATTVILTGASRALAAGPVHAATTLSVGTQTDGIHTLLDISGELKNLPYKIKWSTFTSGPPMIEALSASKIDVGDVGNAPVIFGAASRPGSIKLVATIPQQTSQGDYLVLPGGSTITSAAQLKGKKIAYTQGSSSHGFLIQLLSRVGLTTKDVTLVNLEPGDALTAFSAGQVDAWAIWEPFVTIARTLKPGTKVLPTAKNYAASGLSFVVASTTATKDTARVAAIKDYLVRLKRAMVWGRSHASEWVAAFSKETKLPKAISNVSIKHTMTFVAPIDAAYVKQEQKLADILLTAGVIKKKVTISTLAHNLLGS